MSYLRRELVINISFLLLANLLIKPYYIFFVERKVQNEAGTEMWGLYFTLFSLSMIPQILLDLGITTYANKEISSEKSKYDELWRVTVWIKPFLSLFFFIAFLLLVWIGGYFKSNIKIILWIGANQILASFILFLRAFISGSGRYRWDSILSVADKFVFIILFVGLFLIDAEPLDRFLSIQSISMAISMVVAVILVLHNIKKARYIFPTHTELVSILSKGLPYALIFILMVLYCRMEPVWIDQLRQDGNLQAGLYASAYRLLDAANMMGFLFAGLLLPMFSTMGKKTDEIQSLFEFALRLMFSIAVVIAVSIGFNSDYVMDLLYDLDHGALLVIVIANLIPLTVNYLFTTLITASGRIHQMNMLFSISICTNILCHLLLTKTYGAIGAAWAALITQLITMLVLGYFIQKQKLVILNGNLFFFNIAILIVAITSAVIIHMIPIKSVYKLALQGILLPSILIGFGLIPVKSIFGFFKSHS